LRLATKPNATGSPLPDMMTGIVLVAFLAAKPLIIVLQNLSAQGFAVGNQFSVSRAQAVQRRE